MSTINTALSVLIKCLCIRSYNKPFTKPQKRPANFLALIEIASGSNWLIFLFVIKPGYLPEQPERRGPGERATRRFRVPGRSHPYRDNAGAADQVRFSPFRTWVNRGEGSREERGERGKTVSPTLGGKWWKTEQKSITRGNMHLHIVWSQCRPMSN